MDVFIITIIGEVAKPRALCYVFVITIVICTIIIIFYYYYFFIVIIFPECVAKGSRL